MNVLGIETSCDETSVAVISGDELKSNLISSQDFHIEYGGVVPELSSRAHLQMVMPLVKKSLSESNLTLNDIDVITATAGPGLIGALLVGLTFGKGLSLSLRKPFVPVNHIEGHIFSGFLMENKPKFPYLCLVVSGGHTLLLYVKSDLEIVKLGSTIDDAAGEAFDKVSKMLGLGYPGGPQIQKISERGDPKKINFPVASCKNKYDFSFSGVKTAVLRFLQVNFGGPENVKQEDIPDIASSFQDSIVRALTQKVIIAIDEFNPNSISLVGGVAANVAIRNSMIEIAEKYRKQIIIPDLQFCGDNAAMIAYRGKRLYELGKRFDLTANAYPSMPKDNFIEL